VIPPRYSEHKGDVAHLKPVAALPFLPVAMSASLPAMVRRPYAIVAAFPSAPCPAMTAARKRASLFKQRFAVRPTDRACARG
jgi:hypothetical protein